MAKADETKAAFRQLAKAVHDEADSGRFGEDEGKMLGDRHTALNGAIRGFSATPGSDDAQDSAIAAAGRAERAIATAEPGAIGAATAAIDDAIDLLIAATGASSADAPIAPAPARRGASVAIPAIQGSLRIARRPAARGEFDFTAADAWVEGAAEQAGGGDPTIYNKLITLFPAEALTLYGTGLAIFPSNAGEKFLVLLVCVVILVVIRRSANTSRPAPDSGATNIDGPAVWIALFAFLLWATATDAQWTFGVPLLGLASAMPSHEPIQQWAAFLGAAFVLAAAALYTPKPLPKVE